jgi:two-component system sensor histidine kinase KdpD
MVPEQRRLLETFAALIAIALERVHFVSVAQSTLVDMESERLRNSVLAALSHDLRTPLTALVGLSETLAQELARGTASGGETKALAIRDQARRTARLVDNLLEMARLEAGRINLRRDWQSIEELIGGALAALESSLEARAIDVDVPQDLPLVACDGTLIERVLVNLLENAAKYTPNGSPIRIAARFKDGMIEVAVEDRGPGLPAGRERAIFEKFTRGERESAVPGVGLGLAICRAIVEAHGGTIGAGNREGGGARFAFTLPAGETPPAPVENGSDAAPPAEATEAASRNNA